LSWRVTRSPDAGAIVTPPPTAQDAKGKNVPVAVPPAGDVLTYDVDVIGATFPVTVDPTSVVTSNDGSLYSYGNTTYATSRDASAAKDVNPASWLRVGQLLDVTLYLVFRSYFSFAIPDMSTLIAASLFLEGKVDDSTTDFGIYIHTSTYSNPLVLNDFDLFDGWRAGNTHTGTVLNNSWNSSSYSATWNEIVFNAAGLAAVLAKKNDTFKMAAISKEDYDNSAPPDTESVVFEGSSVSGKEPYLSITYTPPIVVPTVTTQAATNVDTTSCTGNGNITATGGANATRRGFCYKEGTSGDPTTSDSVAYDDGSFTTGSYTKSITGLTAGTGYRVRAYAVNSAGTGYGATVQVTTTASGPSIPVLMNHYRRLRG
jgi:hypothetical protein